MFKESTWEGPLVVPINKKYWMAGEYKGKIS